jgi:serine/threonine protein kinase
MAVAVDQFLRAVLRSGLLNRDELQATLRHVPKADRENPASIADYLVQQGKLTRFQRQKLMQGAALGLVLAHYQIEAPIGRGGMGTVYLARDVRNRQHVALKILPPKKAREADHHLARFQREKELSKLVNHPHLALTFDVGVQQDIHFIAMEYIPGQTLHRLVTKTGPLSVERAAHLFSEVASALEHAHGVGLIHRDLKPSNIMVTPNDHAKVLDLGLAFMEGEEVEDVEVVGGKGYIVGSIDYMAPEQTRDASKVDGRADLYALGCCLYFALTGKPPFPLGSLKEKVRAQRQDEPTLLQNRNPQVPGDFARIVHRLLAKDPSQRYASAADVRAELLPWAGTHAQQPVEQQNDRVFQEAVQQVVEADPVVLTPADDAIIFKIEAVNDEQIIELNFTTVTAPERKQLYLWLTIGVFILIVPAFCSCIGVLWLRK